MIRRLGNTIASRFPHTKDENEIAAQLASAKDGSKSHTNPEVNGLFRTHSGTDHGPTRLGLAHARRRRLRRFS